jgi:hypothetical protein
MRAWGLRLRRAALHSRYRTARYCVPDYKTPSATLILRISELYVPPTYTPVQRFKCDLTIALAWLGAKLVR